MKITSVTKSTVICNFIINIILAFFKFFMAIISNSAALFAEGINSINVSLNQFLLFLGIRKGKREADIFHPFGYSSELYFWSFIIAVILFTVGAIFSWAKGINKFILLQRIENINQVIIFLVIVLVLKIAGFYRIFRNIYLKKDEKKLFSFLRKTKRSELIVIFIHDLTSIVGLTLVSILIFIQYLTEVQLLDGVAAISIGLIQIAIAIILGNEIKMIAQREHVDKETIAKISKSLEEEPEVSRIIFIKSMKISPENILLAIKAEFNPRLTSNEINNLIGGIEKEIKEKFSFIKKIYIEPEISRINK